MKHRFSFLCAACLISLGGAPLGVAAGGLAVKSVGSVERLGGPVQVTVVFSETVDVATASDPLHYTIPGASISAAELMTGLPAEGQLGNGASPYDGRVVDSQCVVLTVTGLSAGAHSLQVTGVTSQDGARTIAGPPVDWTASGFKWTDVGVAPMPGRAIAVGDTGFDLFGGGSQQWFNQDEIAFAYQEVSGDFDARARVVFQDYSSHWARAGLMVREDLNAGVAMPSDHASRYVSMHVNPELDLTDGGGTLSIGNLGWESHHRMETGGQTGTTSIQPGYTYIDLWPQPASTLTYHPPPYPDAWVRLTRTGDRFEGYLGTDGVTWERLSDYKLPLGPTAYVGVEFCPELNNVPTSNPEEARNRLFLAQFRDISINRAAGHVPDGGVTLALLACGILGLWRFLPRRVAAVDAAAPD